MPMLCCPVCAAPLERDGACFRCSNGHGFDVARQGYVNLLPVQQKHSLHPGDPLAQVHARRRFLNGGHYAPIASAVCALLGENCCGSVLDVGCGEGYYLRAVGEKCPALSRFGADISREAVRLAAGADKAASYFVATAAHLPFAAGSFEALLSLFALTVAEEYARVLVPGGIYVQALTEDDHLRGLKETIYPQLIPREKNLSPDLPGFHLKDSRSIRFDFMLTENQEIQDLLSMTPHFWRITREGAQRAAALEQLRDTAHVRLNLFVKEDGND